jgi:hypothetical protein
MRGLLIRAARTVHATTRLGGGRRDPAARTEPSEVPGAARTEPPPAPINIASEGSEGGEGGFRVLGSRRPRGSVVVAVQGFEGVEPVRLTVASLAPPCSLHTDY